MRTGSHLHAQFKGKHKQEFGWFAVSGTNPLASISARRAARKIVSATCSHRADLVISWQAKLMAEVHGIHVLTVAPGLMRTGSHLHAQFKGKHKQEFGWVAVSGTNPPASISGGRERRKR